LNVSESKLERSPNNADNSCTFEYADNEQGHSADDVPGIASNSARSEESKERVAYACGIGPRRLHLSNLPFRFRELDLRNMLKVCSKFLYFFYFYIVIVIFNIIKVIFNIVIVIFNVVNLIFNFVKVIFNIVKVIFNISKGIFDVALVTFCNNEGSFK